ncbi:MAG: hypothetical protein ACAI35_14745 [Candidatus Methylacidiphilales bacterium]|nr:hypothetical protein [Candidatus Methylacidiphilales bacterium]
MPKTSGLPSCACALVGRVPNTSKISAATITLNATRAGETLLQQEKENGARTAGNPL